MQQNSILMLQSEQALLQKKLGKEEKRVKDHHMTKIKEDEFARLKQELETIEKNNSMLRLIEVQYEREIERRLKQEEKARLEEEIGEKILDSPLRRAREYALNIAGSPSPVKRIVRKGTY